MSSKVNYYDTNWIKGIGLGIVAGVIWGWISLLINSISGAFSYESGLLHNIIAFTVGGGIMGAATGGILSLTHKSLPFKNLLPSAIVLSTSMWSLITIGSILLSLFNKERYHPASIQTLQGFILSVILGSILAAIWKLEQSKNR